MREVIGNTSRWCLVYLLGVVLLSYVVSNFAWFCCLSLFLWEFDFLCIWLLLCYLRKTITSLWVSSNEILDIVWVIFYLWMEVVVNEIIVLAKKHTTPLDGDSWNICWVGFILPISDYLRFMLIIHGSLVVSVNSWPIEELNIQRELN